tara:strand:- start:237 stop:971 length:735 start_codon:yes stop_codon:yes gene_type:complete
MSKIFQSITDVPTTPLFGELINPLSPTYREFKSWLMDKRSTPKLYIVEPTADETPEWYLSPDFRYVFSRSFHKRDVVGAKWGDEELWSKGYEAKETDPKAPMLREIIAEILQHNGLELDTLYRSAFNVTLPRANVPGTPKGIALPHVDDNFPHLVMLIYLNTCSGDTILTDRLLNNNEGTYRWPFKDFVQNSPQHESECEILERIPPVADKVVIFDGKRYHYNECPLPGEPHRLALVATFSLKR